MKKIEKFIVAFLAIIIVFTQFSLYTFAEDIKYGIVYSEDNMYRRSDYIQLASNYGSDEALAAIINGLKERKDSINLTEFNLTVDEFKDYYYDIVYSNPDLFYVRSGYEYYFNNQNYITKLIPKYVSGVTDNMINKTNAEVDNIIKTHIVPEMTDAEKALVLHDYLVNTAVYDSAAAESSEVDKYENSYTAYGVIMNKTGVCQSYTMAYGWLLKRCGIDWKYISSKQMNHAWNAVKIDNDWYHIDVTWDDPVSSSKNYCRYDYFLKNDEQITELEHYGWAGGNFCGGGKYSSENWIYSIASTNDYIIKYNNGRYSTEIKVYFEDFSELPEGLNSYYTEGEKKYYLAFAEADFKGENKTIISESDYNAVKYPFDETNFPNLSKYPYTIDKISIKSESDEILDEIPESSPFIVSVDFTKQKERNSEDYVLIGIYDTKNVLLSLDFECTPTVLFKDDKCSMQFHIPKSAETIGSIKAFIWDNLDSMKVLSETIDY